MAFYQQHYPPHAGHQMAQVPYADYPGYPNRYSSGQPVPSFYWGSIYRANMKTDSKPRLSKEEVDKLEAEFQKNNKPNSNLKKGLAEQLGVEVARINNWFQNRRAKKKQMIRAAETEASRNAENAQPEPASSEDEEFFHPSEQNDGLRPSEASSPIQPSHDSEEAVFDDMAHEAMEKVEVSAEEIPSGYTSPYHEPSQHNDAAFDFSQTTDDAFAHSGCDFTGLVATQSPVMACQVTAEMVMPAVPAATCSIPRAIEGISNPDLATFQLGIISSGLEGVGAFSEAELKQDIPAVAPQLDRDIPQPSVESSYAQTTPPTTHAQSFRIKSPPVVDLASRRRRPAPAPLGIRNTSHGLVTAMGFGARSMDPGSPMRRAASATAFPAPQGVRKTPVPPRSPFHERTHENFARLFHTSQMPAINTGISILAPPTPDTPVVPQQATREATASSCSSEEDQLMLYRQSSWSSFGSGMDQNLRTPPATPSNMPDMYPFPNIAFTVHDEPVMTPSLHDTFPEIGAPQYHATGCGSQPPTPSFAPVGSISYQTPFADGTQYNWPTAQSGSAASSPNARVRQLQFNNITAEHFSSSARK